MIAQSPDWLYKNIEMTGCIIKLLFTCRYLTCSVMSYILMLSILHFSFLLLLSADGSHNLSAANSPRWWVHNISKFLILPDGNPWKFIRDNDKCCNVYVAANHKNGIFLDQVCDGYGWLQFMYEFRQNRSKTVYMSFLAFARHTASRCLYFNTNIIPPVPTGGSIWVVLFDFFFLGPLLQHSHWADHFLRAQVRESLFYITLQIWPEPS